MYKSKNKNNIKIFQLKIAIFTAVKICSILHRHVFVIEWVYVAGGASDESYKPMIGTDVLVARASIVQNERKVTAVSKIMAKDWLHSTVDFHILSETVGFPTITVVDDISSWQPGKQSITSRACFRTKLSQLCTLFIILYELNHCVVWLQVFKFGFSNH